MTLLRFAVICITLGMFAFTPSVKKFPALTLKTLDGKSYDVNKNFSKNKLTVISFWATWCSPCKKELDAMKTIYKGWQDIGIEVVAITIDDIQQLNKVKPMVEQKKWSYTILSDVNRESLKKLGFQSVPQTFVVDKEGNIVYSHSGYTPGDEKNLDKKLREML
ncbi:MAG: TlpA family protein disulfide reductase [Saprospiraceae bacterium]|nr:TlpA family protein disulfide reductase [Saprospiraceae bacterium]